MVKNLPANSGDTDLIPGLGRYPGGGNGNPLQYSCLENSMDRGAWWATFHGIARVRHDLVTNYHYLGQITTRYKANTAVRDCLVQTSSYWMPTINSVTYVWASPGSGSFLLHKTGVVCISHLGTSKTELRTCLLIFFTGLGFILWDAHKKCIHCDTY